MRDKKTKLPIPFATVTLYEVVNANTITELRTYETPQDARYEFPLDIDKNYKVLGNAPEYLANEEDFTTFDVMKDTDLEINIDIELDPVDLDSIFTLQNIYYDFDEYYLRPDALEELQNVLKLLRQNPNLTILLESHTDSNGTNLQRRIVQQPCAFSSQVPGPKWH